MTVAQHPGTCPSCGRPTRPGTPIRRHPTTGRWVHDRCPPADELADAVDRWHQARLAHAAALRTPAAASERGARDRTAEAVRHAETHLSAVWVDLTTSGQATP